MSYRHPLDTNHLARALSVAVIAMLIAASACSGSSADPDVSTSSAPLTAPPAAPSVDGLRFTDVSVEAGLTESHSDLALNGNRGMTSGAAVADVNGDGHLDIFLPRVGKADALYINDGSGRFTDIAREAGVSGSADRAGSTAAAFLDADGDGHLDLFVTGITPGDNHLYMNDGTGYFSDQVRTRGLVWDVESSTERDDNMHGITVADVNGDGHLDLLVLHWHTGIYSDSELRALDAARSTPPFSEHGLSSCDAAQVLADADVEPAAEDPEQRHSLSALFLNDGSGHFTDVTDAYGLEFDQVVAFTGVFRDLDGDGWQDLLLTGDFCTSKIYRNIDGRTFVDITDSAGVGTDENGMGSVVKDFNGDGLPDWFISAISFNSGSEPCPADSLSGGCTGNRMFLNNGDLTFSDATEKYGVRDGGWGWGIAAEDFANTGEIQIAMANGFDWGREDADPDDPTTRFYETFKTDRTRFWMRDPGVVGFTDVASDVGINDETIGHALVAFDMDDDGDLDLLIVPSNQPPVLYRNDTPNDRQWLTIELDDPTSPGNRWGDGARVVVHTAGETSPLVDWISTSGSYESQKPPNVHFGFGQGVDDAVTSIEVFWPGQHQPQQLSEITKGQKLKITRSS